MTKNFLKILIIPVILVIGFMASNFLGNTYYQKQTIDLGKAEQESLALYAQKIANEKDAYKLTQNGLRQLRQNLSDMAFASLNQAVKVEKNYRDGWIALAIAQMQTKNYRDARLALLNAEKLDPINPKTYELLKLCYQRMGNFEQAKLAENKYIFLTKR